MNCLFDDVFWSLALCGFRPSGKWHPWAVSAVLALDIHGMYKLATYISIYSGCGVIAASYVEQRELLLELKPTSSPNKVWTERQTLLYKCTLSSIAPEVPSHDTSRAMGCACRDRY
jgi:hypothetical protein